MHAYSTVAEKGQATRPGRQSRPRPSKRTAGLCGIFMRLAATCKNPINCKGTQPGYSSCYGIRSPVLQNAGFGVRDVYTRSEWSWELASDNTDPVPNKIPDGDFFQCKIYDKNNV